MIPSLSDRNKKKKNLRRRFLLLFVSLFAISSWFFVKPLFLFIADPFLSLYFKVSAFVYTDYEKSKAFFTTKEESLAYIKQLEDENSRLHNKISFYENTDCGMEIIDESDNISDFLLEEENKTTKDPCLLTKRNENNQDSLKASLLFSSLSSLFDTVRINKGENDGVQVEDLVFTRGMIAVGKVVSVTPHTALVLLYSKNGQEHFGSIKEDNTSFKVTGNGGGSYIALIPKDVTVQDNAKVLLTEDQDFSLGTVASIEFLKQDVYKKVFIKGGYNPSSLSVVYVAIHAK